jgi:hypothetical protein
MDRGVSIMPLIRVESLCAEAAYRGMKAKSPMALAPRIMFKRFGMRPR